ncbi:MAG: hypothetical protein CMM50_06860 [Rhodospirillaceae bacterium]|nr:hypothetical protein [Rhodospirillaceae bacterium]|tara:strand:- start:54 stop:407 length:354 start_codon:yes stop_codon:yes gene_type:complete
MSKQKLFAYAMVVGAGALIYPQSPWAEGFSSADFLRWDRQSQDFLIQTSVTMVGIVASQTTENFAPCLDRWYSASDDQVRASRHDHILDVMREHPDYHPQAVILAVLKKQCGPLKPD